MPSRTQSATPPFLMAKKNSKYKHAYSQVAIFYQFFCHLREVFRKKCKMHIYGQGAVSFPQGITKAFEVLYLCAKSQNIFAPTIDIEANCHQVEDFLNL